MSLAAFDAWLFCSEPLLCKAVSLKRSKLSPVYVHCMHFTYELKLLGGLSCTEKESDFLGIPRVLMSCLACDSRVKTLLGLMALGGTGALHWHCCPSLYGGAGGGPPPWSLNGTFLPTGNLFLPSHFVSVRHGELPITGQPGSLAVDGLERL